MKLLELKNVTKHFGGLSANNEVSFEVGESDIVGLVGPNGAGKTTLFNCISGYYAPTSGTIVFQGEQIGGMPPYKICARGLARTFQIVQNFQKMTVLENVMVGAFIKYREKSHAVDKSMEVLQLTDLIRRKDDLAADLSPPEQRRLGLSMAMATEPRLLMLDEVMAGLLPKEIDGVLELLSKIRAAGVALIVIEHLMRAVMSICERIVVLDYGNKIAEGTPEDIAGNQRVIEAYLGSRYVAGRKR